MTWLEQIPGVREIEFDGETLPRTNDLIIGTGLAASYDPATRKITLATNASGLPAGTATYQPLTWNGTTWLGAALNLAQAAAVTGVLGVANGGVPVPANPADDAKVLTASGGTYTWTAAPTGLPALGAANTVLRVNAAGLAVEYAKLTTANLDAAAGILGSQLSASAAITATQLAAGGAGNVLLGGASNSWGKITTTQISASAGITATQLAAGAAGTVLIGGASNSFSASPNVTSISFGADPADSGAIRLSHAMGVYGELATPGTDAAVLTWGVVANDVVGLGGASAVTRVTGSALHAYVGATQVAQLGLASGDFLAVGAIPATVGGIRLANATAIYARNFANSANIALCTINASNNVVFGDTANNGIFFDSGSGTTINLRPGGANGIALSGSACNFYISSALLLQMSTNALTWDSALTPTFYQATHATTPHAFTIQAQNVTTGTGSNLDLKSGTGSVASGIVRLYAGSTLAFSAETGANLSMFAAGSFGGGVKVLFGGSVTTAPTTAPAGGGLIYWDASGNPWKVDTGGIHVQL